MHFEFKDTVSEIARGSWGREHSDAREAERELLDDVPRLTAFAILELLRRLEGFSGKHRPDPREKIGGVESALKFPDVKIGDFLYGGDLIDGVVRYIVISKDDDYCVITPTYWEIGDRPYFMLAGREHKRTPKEALIEGLKEDDGYYTRRSEYLLAIKRSVEADEPLDKYLSGYERDD